MSADGTHTHHPCCSSHGVDMTCEEYRRTHFVEVRPCCTDDAAILTGPLTHSEWRTFQNIPEQGYSHRHWVNSRIAERVSAERRRLLDNATIDHARIAVHQALASQWMTIVGALDGDQSRYDRLLTDIATAVLADATVPRDGT